MIHNGDILSIADYPELFSVIGNIYPGGDGITTFALPDDRALVERGLDLGCGYDPDRVLGLEQDDQMQRITGGTASTLGFSMLYLGIGKRFD